MLDPIISRFWQLTHIADSEGFDDKKLSRLAKEQGKTLQEVSQLVARYLLLNFSSQAKFSLQSKLLRKEIQHLSRLYDQVVQAIFRGIDLYTLPTIQQLFSSYTAVKVTQRQLVQTAKGEATAFHEHFRTFPHQYGQGLEPDYSDAEQVFALIDRNWVQRGYHNHNLGPFYYKNIALFLNGQSYTWEKLAHLWVECGGVADNLNRLNPFLPGHSLLIEGPVPRRGVEAKPSFKDYVMEKTVSEYAKVLGVKQLDNETEQELKAACEDENFRMHLVFFLGNTDALQNRELDPESPAYRWILAARETKTALGAEEDSGRILEILHVNLTDAFVEVSLDGLSDYDLPNHNRVDSSRGLTRRDKLGGAAQASLIPFEIRLLQGSGFIPLEITGFLGCIAVGFWVKTDEGYHFHFCFGNPNDHIFVHKKVTYPRKVAGDIDETEFFPYLASKCHKKKTPNDSRFATEEAGIKQFAQDFHREKEEAFTALEEKGHRVPLVGVYGEYPEEILDSSGAIRCSYEGEDPVTVTMTGENTDKEFVIAIPKALYSPIVLQWQRYLFRQI